MVQKERWLLPFRVFGKSFGRSSSEWRWGVINGNRFDKGRRALPRHNNKILTVASWRG